eukprot:TRINITY_DN31323_c0_g2_i4.p1 TRINITY_DN31323_c0_g2~~TRINITY_DN31323_c0_g2_i4.p1  ORF type:complete len:173 (-),score=38.62 TRINITY_DN31323_c0_g2_i4:96-572(-)
MDYDILKERILIALDDPNPITHLKETVQHCSKSDNKGCHAIIEHLIKTKLQERLKHAGDNRLEEVSKVILLALEVVKENLIRPQATFNLIQDVFETLPTKTCALWFPFLESNTDKLREVVSIGDKLGVTKSVNATAIRAFYSLLKRLSRTITTRWSPF